jgi:hypothetical protein
MTSLFLIILMGLIIVFLVYYIVNTIQNCDSYCKKTMPSQTVVINDKVASKPTVDRNNDAHIDPQIGAQTESHIVRTRDMQVLQDPLYPPLARANTDVAHTYMTSPIVRPVPTRSGTNDTFRLVGYLVSDEDRNDVWKLFARQKHAGGRSEFYASPANRNFDMKVALNADVKMTPPLRDVYDIPPQVTIQHPMFNSSTYSIMQLPSSDFTSAYY